MGERHIVVDIYLPFLCDEAGEVLASARPAYLALLAAIAAARPKAVTVVSPFGVVEKTIAARRHLHRHAEGLSCEQEVEIGVAVAEPIGPPGPKG